MDSIPLTGVIPVGGKSRNNIVIEGGTFVNNVYAPASPHAPSAAERVKHLLYPIGSKTSGYIDIHLHHGFYARPVGRAEHTLRKLRSSGNIVVRHEEDYVFHAQCPSIAALAVAYNAKDHGTLLATLLLRRPSEYSNVSQFVIPTLVYQLVDAIPQTAEPILYAINNNPIILKLNTSEQLEKLVVAPLRMAAQQTPPEERKQWPSVIVMDGVTEQFAHGSDAEVILSALTSLAEDDELDINLSVFLSQRPTFIEAASEKTAVLIEWIATDGTLLACLITHETAYYFNLRVHACSTASRRPRAGYCRDH